MRPSKHTKRHKLMLGQTSGLLLWLLSLLLAPFAPAAESASLTAVMELSALEKDKSFSLIFAQSLQTSLGSSLTFWQDYKWTIVGVVTLCVLQALLISVLLVERAQHRRARAALDERLRFKALLTRLPAEFATLPATSVDQGIQKWVKHLSDFLGVEDGVFLELTKDDNLTGLDHTQLFAGLPDAQRHAYLEQLHGGVTVNLARLPETSDEQRHNASPRVRSLLAIPIAANETACALAFATTKAYRDWPEDLVARLRLAGGIFASAVVHRKREQALGESEARYRAFFELAAVGAGQASPVDGRLLRVNDAHCRITGHTREELLALRFSDITHPDDREQDLEKFRRLIRGEVSEYSSEKRYIRKNGAPVWVQVDVSLVRDAFGRPLHTVAIVQDINARKRAQDALSRSEAFNRRIIESSADWMSILDLEGRLVYMNPGGQRLMQIADISTWLEKAWPSLWQAEDSVAALSAVATAKAGGTATFQGRCPSELGIPKWWDVVASPMKDAERNVDRLLIIARDITEKKKIEYLRMGEKEVIEMIAANAPLDDILSSLTHLIEDQADGMICSTLLLDEDGIHARHRGVSSLPDSYTRAIDGVMIGPKVGSCGTAMYRREPVVVCDILADPLWENYRDLAVQHGLRSCWSTPILSSQGNVLGSFAVYYRQPRSPKPAESELIDRAARIAGIAIERRRADNELRDSEAKNRALLAALPDMMFLMNGDGVYLDYHIRNRDELYIPPEHFLGKKMREILPVELAEAFALKFEQAEQSGAVVTLEYSLPVSDENRFFEARIVRCNHDKYLSIVRDVTHRKRDDEILRQSQERYSLATNAGGIGVWDWNLETGASYADPLLKVFVGYEDDKATHRADDFWLFVYPDDLDLVKRSIEEHVEGKTEELNLEHRVLHRDGSIRWLHVRGSAIKNADGKPCRMVGTTVDVTERKRAAAALCEINERLNLALEAGRMGAWDWDLTNNKVVWSRDVFVILGREPFGDEPTPENFMMQVHPDDRARVEAMTRQTILAKQQSTCEYRVLLAGGEVIWVESRATVIRNAAGECIAMKGLLIDITERKQVEIALRQSEERFRQLAENIDSLFFITEGGTETTPGRMIYVSPAYERIWGRSCESLYRETRSWMKIVHPEDKDRLKAALPRIWKGSFDEEFRIVRDDQQIRWVHGRVFPVFDQRGELYRVAGIVDDITTRKQAQEALRDSEERYRNVVETQTELICRFNCDTTLTFVNDAYCRYFGKTRAELIGRKFLELIPEEARPAAITHLDSLIASPHPESHEHQVIRADGTIGWQQWINYAIRDVDGTIIEMQAIGRDITERKWLEQNLQDREREFSTVLENSPDIISRLDRDMRFTYINPAVERMLGISPDEFVGKTTREVGALSRDWVALEASCRHAIATRETVDREFSLDGRQYHSRLIPEFGASGSVESVLCISEDITQRRRVERELVQMSARLLRLQDEERRRIARQLHDGTAQNLFATTINLSRLRSSTILQEDKAVLDECQSLCDQALQELRTLSYLLHPPILDELGLVSALKWYVDGFSKRSGIEVALDVPQEIDRLSRELEVDLFRIVQECLGNIHRHSGSSTADVHLEKQENQIFLRVRDKGRGIQPEVLTGTHASTLGVGILGMRQRLRQLDGYLQIESGPQGTTVVATVPIRVERRHRARGSRVQATVDLRPS